MDVLLSFAVFLAALVCSIVLKFSILIPLGIGLAAFVVMAFCRGHSPAAVLKMMAAGVRKSLGVIIILMLLGMITALWRAAGTIPYIVYHSVKLIHPSIFIVSVFLLCSVFSYLTGSTLGTAGTIGIVMMVLARAGGVDLYLTAGAVISGGVFGDRNSPFSNSANLIATVTKTNIYTNVKNMFRTGMIPWILTLGIFAVYSFRNPLQVQNTGMLQDMPSLFRLSVWTLVPAVLVFILSLMRIKVMYTLAASVIASILICLLVQGQPLGEILQSIVIGFHMEDQGELAAIMSGGGLQSMVNTFFIILISSTYSGIFQGTGMMSVVEKLIGKMSEKAGCYLTTLLSGLVIACFSCNQTLSTMLTCELVGPAYEAKSRDKYEFALHMENTVVLIAGLLPWSIACASPLAALGSDLGAIRYEFLPFLLIGLNAVWGIGKEWKEKKSAKGAVSAGAAGE